MLLQQWAEAKTTHGSKKSVYRCLTNYTEEEKANLLEEESKGLGPHYNKTESGEIYKYGAFLGEKNGLMYKCLYKK